MEEGDGGWEAVVVVDDVGQVGHGLVALVDGSDERVGVLDGGIGWVDGVDSALPTEETTDAMSIYISYELAERREGNAEFTYSGSSSCTQFVSSSSSLAMTITLSPTAPLWGE